MKTFKTVTRYISYLGVGRLDLPDSPIIPTEQTWEADWASHDTVVQTCCAIGTIDTIFYVGDRDIAVYDGLTGQAFFPDGRIVANPPTKPDGSLYDPTFQGPDAFEAITDELTKQLS